MENDAENTDFIENEDEDVLEERKVISEYMAATGGSADEDVKERVVAVKGLRKVFKTNEGAGGGEKSEGDEGKKSWFKKKSAKSEVRSKKKGYEKNNHQIVFY